MADDDNLGGIRMLKVRRLGEGSFGTVHLAESDIPSHPLIAVKSCFLLSDEFESFEKEVPILQLLRYSPCPEIIGYLGYNLTTEFQDGEETTCFNLLLEYANAGTLSDIIIKAGGRLSEPEIKCFTRMLLRGLCTLHGNGIVHCDFKPDNILASSKGGHTQLKIADFGLAMLVGDACTGERFIGTPLYMSPESVSTCKKISPALDIWSLGCVVVEMFTGKPAMDRDQDIDQLACDLVSMRSPIRELIPKTMSMAGRDFLSKCFDLDAGQRCSAYQLLQHPFIWGINSNGSSSSSNCHKMVTTSLQPLTHVPFS